MHKIIRISGSSDQNFDAAINNIISDLNIKNIKCYNFTVIEQKGYFSASNLIYQVTLELEVDFDEHHCCDSKQNRYKNDSSEIICQWCGCTTSLPVDSNSERINSSFVCNSCGRIISVSDKFKNKLK